MHLIIAHRFRYAIDRMNIALDSGIVFKRTSELEGILRNGTPFRIVSLDHEIRGYRPETYQIIWADNRTFQERRKADEMEFILSMRDTAKEEII